MRTENYLYVIGASKPSQIESNVDALYNLNFTKEELEQIDKNLK
jgi:aryl-alcohol dehydrogenase-like predicted oxidoreductase